MRLFREIRWMWLGLVVLLAVPGTALTATKKAKAKKKVAAKVTQKQTGKTSSPLSFQIGDVTLQFGGFVDAMLVFRDTNVGTGIGTGFGTLPYNNTVAGNMSELRVSAQGSRFSMKVTDDIDDTHVTGYMETDFWGNAPANLCVSTNSDTLRLRQFFVNVENGGWEFLAGQAWSWMTANRKGMSPGPADVYVSKNVDNLFLVGVSYARATQFRVTYHTSDSFALGLGVENPQQYIGTSVVLPPALIGQFDPGTSFATPNLLPDFIAKMAFDQENIHVDLAGYLRTFQAEAMSVSGTWTKYAAVGVGGALCANIGLTNEVHLIGTGLLGNGGGRYLGALGPDVVALPDGADITLSPVVCYGLTGGIEAQVTSSTTLAGYFGMVTFDKNTSTGDTYGFGGPVAAPSLNNKYIREFSVNWYQTFWKSPAHGALQYGLQYAWVGRIPWYVPYGQPGEASSNMVFTEVKYILP